MQCFLGSWLTSLWLKLPFPELYSLRPVVHIMEPWPSLDYLSDIPFPPKPSDFVPSVWFTLLLTSLHFLRPKTNANTWSLCPSWRSCTITKTCRKVCRKIKKYWFSFLRAANSIELSHLSAAIKATSLLPGSISAFSSSNVRLFQLRYVKL